MDQSLDGVIAACRGVIAAIAAAADRVTAIA